jgi:fructose-1,6-bisphosphatase/sedoheptulose 1,7-bisphosphatase-like protein
LDLVVWERVVVPALGVTDVQRALVTRVERQGVRVLEARGGTAGGVVGVAAEATLAGDCDQLARLAAQQLDAG